MSTESQSLEVIRSEVCDATLKGIAALSLPALALSLSRALETGWNPVLSAHIIATTAIIAAAVFHRHLGYRLRANLILGVFFWLAWAGQVFSSAPTAFVYLVSVSIMATVFYGERYGILCVAAGILMMISTYLGFKYGIYPAMNSGTGTNLTAWLSRAASVIIASLGPLIAVSRFWSSLVADRRRAQAASDAKSEFLGMMSHELRTPMAAIIGTAELLETESLRPEMAERVHRISRSGKNLLSLLNDLLDFAKIEAQQMNLEDVAFSLNEVLEEIGELFTPLAAAKGLELKLEYPAEYRDILRGDPGRLRQIIQNLVGNAIKFTDHGWVHIWVAVRDVGGGRFLAQVVVEDTGPGISPSDQQRLFQPFVQGENVVVRRHGGTGLGLAISRKLTKLMGGELTLRSAIGQGSTFTLEIPFAAGQLPATLDVSITPEAQPTKARRVLIAEDNEILRDILRARLTQRGHDVACVVNGREALAAAEAGGYDIVLMDMHMPVMDGMEATRAIRSLRTGAAQVSIVALTAGLTSSQRSAYLAAGVDNIVPKPVHWPTLFTIVEGGEAIDRKAKAPPEPETQTPVLNESVLADLRQMLGSAAVADMLASLLRYVRDYEDTIRAAFADHDLRAVKLAAHGMKGVCLQFGALELGALASKMETLEMAPLQAEVPLADLSRAVARLDQALTACAYRDGPA